MQFAEFGPVRFGFDRTFSGRRLVRFDGSGSKDPSNQSNLGLATNLRGGICTAGALLMSLLLVRFGSILVRSNSANLDAPHDRDGDSRVARKRTGPPRGSAALAGDAAPRHCLYTGFSRGLSVSTQSQGFEAL